MESISVTESRSLFIIRSCSRETEGLVSKSISGTPSAGMRSRVLVEVVARTLSPTGPGATFHIDRSRKELYWYPTVLLELAEVPAKP